MEIFPLNIFPQASLASSVITTVWIGIFVVVFFNLRFGWVLSGLVVPGYMVPLLLVKPWAAVAIFIEAFVSYIIVRYYSEGLSRYGILHSLFGRDRFFAFVLVSVIVRLLFDGAIFPALGTLLEQSFGISFDYRNNLHSFGLIIIALMANQFWKSGFARGLYPLIITMAVTYLIVRFGLMELTNFSISNLSYMYEDIASNILASPKAYIILITAAFIASRMNIHYGWEYNGILIPALLALLWYEPSKILASFVEAFLILLVGSWLLKLSWFDNRNMEGARKLLLFFNISFAYKFALGYALITWWPEIKVTDSYAFGYLLATLMAVKMHDKEIAARMTRATLQTSLVAVVVASIVGFALTFLPPLQLFSVQTPAVELTVQPSTTNKKLLDQIREDKVALYHNRGSVGVVMPLPAEVDNFRNALRAIDDYRQNRTQQTLEIARGYLAGANYQLILLESRYLYLSEKSPGYGWGIYVISVDIEDGLLLEVPAPLDESGTLETGVWLMQQFDGRALAVAGSRRRENADGSADVLLNRNTLYQLFHRHYAKQNVLQVRGYTPQNIRQLAGLRRDETDFDLPQLSSAMYVRASLPEALNLVELKRLVNPIDVHWDQTPMNNIQRQTSHKGFAELFLNKRDMQRLVSRAFLKEHQMTMQQGSQRIDGYLQQWLLSGKGRIAARGTQVYKTPAVEELLFFDDEVLTPLLEVMATQYNDGEWTDSGLETLRSISAASSILNYQVIQYQHSSGQDFLILAEREETGQRRYWGTYVFRLGPANNYLVQIPRPLYETNSFEYAVSLFERLDARALMISGAHPYTNIDGSSDLIRMPNIRSLFSLVGQVVLRESADVPMLVLHSRAYGQRSDAPSPSEDVLLAFASGANLKGGLQPLAQSLLDIFKVDGVNYRFVDGAIETAGYEVGSVPQSLYLEASQNKDFGIIWVSPAVRAGYRQQSENRQHQAQFAALGLEDSEMDLAAFVMQKRARSQHHLVDSLVVQVDDYVAHADIVSLRALMHSWRGYTFSRMVDSNTRQAYLLIRKAKNKQLVALVNLAPTTQQRLKLSPTVQDQKAIQEFIDRRQAWLTFEGGK